MKFFNFGASVSKPVEMAADVFASEEPIAHLQFQESNPEADTETEKEFALLKSENDLLKSENALLRSENEELKTNHSSETRQLKEHIHELLDRIHHFEKNIASKVTESFTQTEATVGEDQDNSQSVSVSGTSASILPKASGAISKEAITKETPPQSGEKNPRVKSLKKKRSFQKSNFFQLDLSSICPHPNIATSMLQKKSLPNPLSLHHQYQFLMKTIFQVSQVKSHLMQGSLAKHPSHLLQLLWLVLHHPLPPQHCSIQQEHPILRHQTHFYLKSQ